MTRWRWRRDDPDFPDPVVINGIEYFYDDEMEAYEAARRRRAKPATTPETTTTSKHP